jgi:hypothetical protein
MEQTNLASKLQKVADYRTVRKSLKKSGMWSILFGAIAVVWGLWPPVDFILTALGTVLISTGIWNIVAPRPTGIILDGITLLLVGAYNLLGSILAMINGEGASPRWAVLGLFQLVWGVQRIASFKRFAHAFAEKPPDSELEQIEQTVDAIRKTKTKESADTVQIRVNGVHTTIWMARFSGNEAVFVESGGGDVLVGSKDTVTIENRGKVMIGNAVKTKITINGMTLEGTMSPDAYRLYEQWKTGVVIPKAYAA